MHDSEHEQVQKGLNEQVQNEQVQIGLKRSKTALTGNCHDVPMYEQPMGIYSEQLHRI